MSRHLDQDLPLATRTQISAHMMTCRHCARYGGQLAAVMRTLPAAASQEALDPAVEDQIMTRLRRQAPLLATSTGARQAAGAVPAMLRLLGEALFVGLAGLAAWEVFARFVAPMWLGFVLDPDTLIDAALGITGPGAMMVHLGTGLLLFPLVFLLVARPLVRMLAPILPWWGVAGMFGFVLWVFASYFVASLMGGMPAFFGFGAVAWASLVGHGALALSMGAATHLRNADA